jgi:hypothetical protein
MVIRDGSKDSNHTTDGGKRSKSSAKDAEKAAGKAPDDDN